MLKKIIIAGIFFNVTLQSQAQFFRGFGFFGGATSSRHSYTNKSEPNSVFFPHKLPSPSHNSAEYVSWNAGLFAEFLKYEHIRWQTELEYTNKGAVENPFLSPISDARAGKTANKLSYIQWNNYAKIFLREGYRGTPYVMLGAKLEYNLLKSITAYPTVAGALPKIQVSPDAAVGYEFLAYSKWKFFSELHYNPDIIKKRFNNIDFSNRTWELRIGLIYRPKKSIDDCNAPRYHGSNY